MLISNDLMPYIYRLLKRGNFGFLKLNPLIWNHTTKRLQNSLTYQERVGKLVTFILLNAASLAFISFYHFKEIPFRAIQGFFAVFLLVCVSLHWFFISHSYEFTRFFNGLLDFEMLYGPGFPSSSFKTKGVKLICELQHYSLIPMTTLLAFTGALAPDSPFNSFNLFYFSYTPSLSPVGIVNFFVVWISNFLLWYITLPVLNLVLSCNVAVSLYALNILPEIYNRMALNSYIRPRCHRTRFNDNDMSYKADVSINFEEPAQSYRVIQLLCSLYNELHMNLIITPLICSTFVSQIVYLFALVEYNTNEGILIFLFALIILMNAAAFSISSCGEAANLHTSSVLMKKTLLFEMGCRRGMLGSSKFNWFRKFIKSCHSVRIGFFMNTYFDKLTPLKIELFCMDKTAALLLLSS